MSEQTVRVTLWEGENEEIYITDAHYITDADYGDYGNEQHLKEYGIDLPVELLDESKSVHARWKEIQVKLVKFVESLEPTSREDAFREVVFYNSYTWDQFHLQPDCDHADTITIMRRNQSELAEIVGKKVPARGGRTCQRCASSLYWVMNTVTVQRFFTGEIRSRT